MEIEAVYMNDDVNSFVRHSHTGSPFACRERGRYYAYTTHSHAYRVHPPSNP